MLSDRDNLKQATLQNRLNQVNIAEDDDNLQLENERNQNDQQQVETLRVNTEQGLLKNKLRGGSILGNKKQRVDLSWKDLSVNYVNPKTQEKKPLLQNQTGYIKSGEMLAIMGPSGAGKTTLLSLLIGRTQNNKNGIVTTGDIYANNRPITASKLNRICSFVMQDDILLQTLTPRESLMFVANLKVEGTSDDKIRRVDEILQLLQLNNCQNTLIGGHMIKGISGGERKRTSIAIELITDPQILVLDEPTSGLDSFTSFLVIQLLKTLAVQNNKTIIFTIHSPNSDIFEIFDRLLLLRDGQTVYQGTKSDLIPYFDRIGLQIPQFSNPADFFMEVLNDPVLSKKSLNPQNYEQHQGPQVEQQLATLEATEILMEGRQATFLEEFQQVASRALKNYLRNPMTFKARIGQTFFIAFVVCSLYFRIDKNMENIGNDFNKFKSYQQDYGGVLFFLTLNLFMGNYQNVILTFTQERAVFLREESSQLYRVSSYFLGKLFVELPLLLSVQVVFVCIIYFTIGFYFSATRFFEFLFLVLIESVMANSLGLLVGSLFKDDKVVMAVSPLFVVPQFYFAGFGANLPTMPVWLNWIQYIVPFKYLFEGYMVNQQGGIVYNIQNSIINPLSFFDFKLGYWNCVGISIGFSVGYSIIGYLALNAQKNKTG